MTIELTPALKAHLKDKKRHIITVEVATTDHSDFDVAEIYIRLVTDEFARYLIAKKGYRARETADGETILLPSYHLEYETTVTFDIKKSLFFNKIVYTGIKL